MVSTFRYERKLWKKGYKVVVGADEVGRGAWAGPVVAAATAFAPQIKNLKLKIKNGGITIDDSKKLTARQRERAEKWIKKNALCWGTGEASVSEINKHGMGKASRSAFRRAITKCKKGLQTTDYRLQPGKAVDRRLSAVDFLLIDAFYLPYTAGFPVGKRGRGKKARQMAIINGDEKCFSIAAASILAKVYRDKLMRRLSRKRSRYGWARNKGYGTSEHQRAIKRYGLTRLHRKKFIPAPVLSQAPGDA